MHRGRPRRGWSLGILALGPLLVAAQGPPARTPAEQKPEQPLLRLLHAENTLSELLDASSAALGIAIEYVPSEVEGSVIVRLDQRISAEALLDFTNRALAARGMTTVQMPGSEALTVVKLDQAAGLARVEESARVDTHAGFVRLLLRLDHERTDSIADATKLVLSKSGAVSAFKDSRALLVSDLRPHVIQAQRLALELDSSADEVAVVEIELFHTSAIAVTALVDRISNAKKAVFGDKGKGMLLASPESHSVLVVAPAIELDVWRGLIERFDRAEPVRTINYSPRRFALGETAKLIEEIVRPGVGADAEPWRVVIDGLTGTLVVTSTPSRHAEIEALLERLEAMAESSRKPIRSFAIRNRGVEEMRDLLQGLLDAGALKGAAPKADAPAEKPAQGVSGPLPATPSVQPIRSDELGDRVILSVDASTNRLVAMGEARVLEQLERIITELDVRRPQVLVEAMVVSLSDADSLQLGVEIQKLGVSGDVQWRLASVFGLGAPDPAGIGVAVPTGAGGTGVVLDPGNFSAIVRALQTVNHGRTLTMPKMLVNNNQPATLDSVLQSPYASTNASTTVATTSFGGTFDAGTQISVTPQIADGDQLVLDYTISISQLVGAPASPDLPPPKQENKLKSIVTVPDGHTVVVGGLEVASEGEGESQVPFLGNIPIIGALFSDRSTTTSRTRFFVFLRCNVMRAGGFEDLKYASRAPLQAAGIDDGWPRLEPRVMR